MKIALITVLNLIYTPYLYKYKKILEDNKIDFDIILWDRLLDSNKEEKEKNVYAFHHKSAMNKFKGFKIIDFILYKKFVLNLLQKNKYDKIIVLTSQTAVLLNEYIKKNYPGEYLFDIRDYTNEEKTYYKKIINNLVKNSRFTAVSSLGFLKWLPHSDKYILNHNISYSDLNNKDFPIISAVKNEKINISCIGMIRYFEANKKIIDELANNNKFHLNYAGHGLCEEQLKKYCKKNNITNITFYGKYLPHEKPDFYLKTDIINNLFGNNNLEVSSSISNRFYDAVNYGKPILVNKGTYISEIVQKYNLGISIDFDEKNNTEKIMDYNNKYDSRKFRQNCITYLDDIKNDEKFFIQKVIDFINN